MEKFKNIVGKIQVQKESDGDGYWIHDEECFICGSLGLNEDKVKDLIKRVEGFDKAIELNKFEDWHEDYGSCLWWKFPIEEEPYVGTPLDFDFPEEFTHFTRLITPNEPIVDIANLVAT